ncbi:MAG: hypothetical protein OHK0046_29740 [Anaerolineae bacterium]
MDKSEKPVTELEIASVRHSLGLIRSQIKSGQVNTELLSKQVEKMDNLLVRLNQEHATIRQNARFEALYNISRLIGSSLDLQTVLDQVMDAILQLTGAERGLLMLRDGDGGLKVKAARNLDQQSLSEQDLKFSGTIANQVMDNGQPILTTNAVEDPRFAERISVVTQALRSVMATPLRARGSVIGLIYVDNRAFTGLFNQDDLSALDAFSTQAAIAIDNARLFSATDQELGRRIEELRQLRRIDLLLNETLDTEKSVNFTLEWACRLSGATSGHLGLFENRSKPVIYHYGVMQPAFEYLDREYPEIGQVIQSGRSLTTRTNGRLTLIVPIKRENHMMGVLVLNKTDDTPFSEDHQDLVERVVARAAGAIENARLYSAVQAANNAKSEFVGIVAHDLKAPMTAIKGYAEMMPYLGSLDERQLDFVQRIQATVERMEMLVSDLADISRIESGNFRMDEIRVSVAEVIQALKDTTQPQIEERKHILVENIESNLPELWVDYYRLLQVLTNLVSNAYKYTPEGGTITLAVHRTARGRVEFSVADTGIGLSDEALRKLGTKFWRAEDSFTRAQPGTGLGFAITKNLVEQMGDQIRIESELGKGSKFSFSVQVAKDEDRHAETPLPLTAP